MLLLTMCTGDKGVKANISFEFAQCFTGYLCSPIHQSADLKGYTLAEGNFFHSFTASHI